MPTKYSPRRGPSTSDLMIIADAPTKNDMLNGKPFSTAGAVWFMQELEIAGHRFAECVAMTALDFHPPRGIARNVFHTKTAASKLPDVNLSNGQYVDKRVLANAKRVWETIERVKPKFILALGDVALWMLCGETSVDAHRGSMLEIQRSWGTIRLLPTYHPNTIMKRKQLKRVFRNDLARINIRGNGWSRPDFNFITYPDASRVLATVQSLILRAETERILLASDIETRGGLISVLGFAWSKTDAIAIPFTSVARPNYFTPEEEGEIVCAVRRLFTHKNVDIVGQGYQYDDQYLTKLYGFPFHTAHDTQHMAHCLWTKNLPLRLDFLASMFCDWYRFWKDDGKKFHESITRESDEQIYFDYNCYDTCYTWEIANKLLPVMQSSDFKPAYDFQTAMRHPVARTLNRGVRFDPKRQAEMRGKVDEQIAAYARWFESLPINDYFANTKGVPWYNSAHKLKQLFYGIFSMEEIKKRTANGMRPTADQNALMTIGKREPIFKTLCEKLCEYSSLLQFRNLYLSALPDTDGRMRTNYDLAGTDTFRLASRQDVFGTGLNLQNISKG